MNLFVFANNLTRIMDERTVSPGYLADTTGAYIGSVRKYMSGERFPKLNVIAAISEVLDISPDDLFVGLIGRTDIDDLKELHSFLTGEPSTKLRLLRANTEELALYLKERQPSLLNAGFGKRLKTVREDAGRTVKEVAEIYGCSASQIYSIESGPHLPTFEGFVRLCDALSVSPSFLMKDMLAESSKPFGNDPLMKLVMELTPHKIALVTRLAHNIMTK